MGMTLTHALMGEHGAMYPLLDLIEQRVPHAPLAEVKTLASCLQATLVTHAEIEDALLRPAIAQHLPSPPPNPDGTPGPTDHDIIRGLLLATLAASDTAEAQALLLKTIAKTRTHFRKEETIIFGIAERELSQSQHEAMGEAWAERRGLALAATLS